MARIIENEGNRRIIKLSGADIISIVREYQQLVPRYSNFEKITDCLNDINIYIPEDI